MTEENKLLAIQMALLVPKTQYNNYGKYDYRSVEDILEKLKPFLKIYGLTLGMTDEIVQIGDRYYVKSKVILYEGTSVIAETIGYAREASLQKGMQEAQITGATSSYARKSALGGMFLLDDCRDPDNTNTKKESNPSKRKTLINPHEERPKPPETPLPEGHSVRDSEIENPEPSKIVCQDRSGQLVAKIYCDKSCDKREGCQSWEEL